jgi:hypothetical protein
VPPLRERPGAISNIANSFLERDDVHAPQGLDDRRGCVRIVDAGALGGQRARADHALERATCQCHRSPRGQR